MMLSVMPCALVWLAGKTDNASNNTRIMVGSNGNGWRLEKQ